MVFSRFGRGKADGQDDTPQPGGDRPPVISGPAADAVVSAAAASDGAEPRPARRRRSPRAARPADAETPDAPPASTPAPAPAPTADAESDTAKPRRRRRTPVKNDLPDEPPATEVPLPASLTALTAPAAAAEPDEAGRPRRRRRRRTASDDVAETAKAEPAAVAETPAPPARSPDEEPARTRSRGGRRRTPRPAAETTPAAEPEPLGIEGVLRGLNASVERLSSRLEDLRRPAALAKIGVFVDVPNVMYAAERSRVTIDYARLLDYLVGNHELVRAAAYAPISDDLTLPLETQRFVQPFVARGYRIVTKPLKRFADGTVKANFDVELAIDILTMSDRLDVVTLVSGDGDFGRLVELVMSKGVRVEVVAFGHSCAAELRATADRFIELSDYVRDLERNKT